MFKFRSQAKFVDKEGRLLPEAFNSLQPSTKDILTFTAQSFVTDEQAVIYLPSSQTINFTRNGQTVVITSSMITVNPGDAMSLASPQAITFIPL